MAVKIANKRIEQRGREIRRFVKFLNATYDVPDIVNLHILNFPCTYDDNLEPVFGLFYFDEQDEIRIEIANDFSWYEKLHKEKFGKKFCTYMSLSCIAHEFCHYVRYRDGKKYLLENWIDHQANKILKEYINQCSTILTENYIDQFSSSKDSVNEDLEAMNPVSFIRKKAALKEKILWS